MNAESINNFFLIGAFLTAVSVLLSSVSSRVGLPILLVFLCVGILAGEDGPGGIVFDNYSVAYLVSNLALAIILLDGGMRTRVSSFRVALWPALSLATFGVALTTIITGLLATWLFDLTLLQGMLVGAIVGSTDAAVVFSLLKGKSINERVGATLEIESGSNDPMAVFLTVTLIAVIANTNNDMSFSFMLTSFVKQFGIGGILGIGGGWVLWQLVNRSHLADGLYAILVLSGGLMIYAISSKLGGSGILSIYLVGLFLGNNATRGKHTILNILDGMTWMSQIGMFLVLGLLLTPSDLIDLALPALGLAFGMIFVARPISVWFSLIPFKSFKTRDRWFISWVGLRGAVPIILAVFPMMAGLPGAQLYFNLAFFVVLVSLLVQGTTLAKAAKLAKVELPIKPTPASRSGLEVYHKSDWELFVYHLSEHKWCIGEPLRRLEMPEGTRIAALFRDRVMLHPSGSTQLKAGDVLCVLAHEHDLDALGTLFSQPPEDKELPRFFGDFFIDANVLLSDFAPMYGIKLSSEFEHLSISELVSMQLGEKPVVGDQFEWESLHWVISEIRNGAPHKVGIRLPASE
ncbi:potassium/proton antiporter [Shewanella surugensis]|uniref:K(+)/H(+) antiporter NhaP2 n=1 Tax=Shewanella surugensis TaxID=212020 RepID=A0ABT0LDY4_9GAMM|nr:potassium/proton antiporter [Shewanella surugensis]MCL1125914.1 potassium/proton antiporter [Shewanella surugensis]